MKIKFYGTRGSTSIEGTDYHRFGGATTCCILTIGNKRFMIDAGSGVTSAIKDLDTEGELYLLFTHVHLDHLSGIAPLLSAFSKGKIHIYGKTRNGIGIAQQISEFMRPPYWPVSSGLYENVGYSDVPEDDFFIGNVRIRTMNSNHPNGATLYRFETSDGNESVVFAFDFNHADGYDEKLTKFAQNADILIFDGNIQENEYALHSDWGHSTPKIGAEIAQKAGAALIVTHHSSNATDIQLENELQKIKSITPDAVFASDGMSVEFTTDGMKVVSESERERDILGCLLEVGIMLSSEKDTDILLEK